MKVLVAHVRYRQFGGEDAVVDHELQLLRDAGVDVMELTPRSTDFDSLPSAVKAEIMLSGGSSRYGRSLMADALASRPDIVHLHNLYPLLGVGALEEASRSCGVVHTWHNYRVSCLAGTHVFNDWSCMDCRVGSWGAGVRRACYRGSVAQSIWMERAISRQLALMRRGIPDRVLCVTDFQKALYESQGVPAERLIVKPNSVDRGARCDWTRRDGVVYVGRLSPEKGVMGLLDSWEPGDPLLRIVGDGPLMASVKERVAGKGNVALLGSVDGMRVREVVRTARAVVFPSLCMEGLPLTVLESLSEGTPVVCFDGGAVERVASTVSVRFGDYGAMREHARRLAHESEQAWQELSNRALEAFSERYTDEQNVRSLLKTYSDVLGRREGGRS